MPRTRRQRTASRLSKTSSRGTTKRLCGKPFDKKDLDEKKLAGGTDKEEAMKLLEKVVATAMLGKNEETTPQCPETACS